jgi:3-oxoacyl-[acyl-carrier protein] reductase
MDLSLGGKVALVCGSSRGIGLAAARAFLREGASVVITGRDAVALEQASAALISESDPERVFAVQADLTEPADIERTLDTGAAAFGGYDIVVANVGSGTARAGWELDLQDWESALRVNLLGGMVLAGAALTHLVARGGGSLIFISSIAGYEAINAPLAYSAAKAAVLSGMKNLSRLAGPKGVRVNAVAPGNVYFPGGSWARKLAERPEFFEQYIQSEVPLKRFGRPEEIADAIVFLASERASFITGSCLVVDGGQTRSF